MKRKLISIWMLLLLLVASCQRVEDESLSVENYVVENYTGMERNVMINIMTTRFGGYKNGKQLSRAIGNVSLTPYVEDGDTLMYVAQYENGWELYSANTATQMIIFSSDEGVFDMNDPNMPDPFRNILMDKLEEIRNTPKEGLPINRSWGGIGITKEELDNVPVICHTKNGVHTRSGEDYPEGDWFLLESEDLSTEVETSPKLISTKWGQQYPWNQYTKMKKDSNNNLTHTPVGCVPVAIGQYLYYTHFKDGLPSNTVATASPINNGTDFNFSGSSGTIWDNMAKIWWNVGTQETALLLGYIGREMNADYDHDGTAVYPSQWFSYLNRTYSNVFSNEKYDNNYVVRSLDRSYPVIISDYGYATTDIKKENKVGHLFLIDQYRKTTEKTRCVYGLIRDEWDGDGDDPYQDNEVDEEGNITGFAYTKEVILTSNTVEFSMNWGWNGSTYDSKWYRSVYTWTAGGYDFYLNRTMLKRTDIK